MSHASSDAATPVVSAFYDRFPYPGDPLQDGPPPGYNWRWNLRSVDQAVLGRVSASHAAGTPLKILDAGCGTGTLAIEAAQRGAEVVAVDLSPTLVNLARERLRDLNQTLDVTFLVGDMRDMDLGSFDYAVAMDSLIHYDVADGVQTLEAMAAQIHRKMVFTFAPKTPLLALMHAAGKFFPRADRAPSIEPVSPGRLSRHLDDVGLTQDWVAGRSHRIDVGFYKSHAMELTRR